MREVGAMALDAARQAGGRLRWPSGERGCREGAAAKAARGGCATLGRRVLSPQGTRQLQSSRGSPLRRQPRQSAGGRTVTVREVVIDPVARFNERADALAARLQKLQQAFSSGQQWEPKCWVQRRTPVRPPSWPTRRSIPVSSKSPRMLARCSGERIQARKIEPTVPYSSDAPGEVLADAPASARRCSRFPASSR